MGEFTNGEVPGAELMAQRTQVNDVPDGFETDVPGIKAHGVKDGLPVFDVDDTDFYKNLKSDRKRLRFAADSEASKYLQQTKYRRPFYVRTKDQAYMRKVK